MLYLQAFAELTDEQPVSGGLQCQQCFVLFRAQFRPQIEVVFAEAQEFAPGVAECRQFLIVFGFYRCQPHFRLSLHDASATPAPKGRRHFNSLCVSAKALTANSRSSRECAAETCVRTRAVPCGTT